MNRISYLAWGCLFLALMAWGGVWLFADYIGREEERHLTLLAEIQQSSARQGSQTRTHALAKETKQERSSLADIFKTDVVSVANLLTATGKLAGVKMKLSGALPEVAPEVAPGGQSLQAVGFVVQADGTFAALMRAAQLFEALPIPSSLTRLDLQYIPGSGSSGGTWHMNAYLFVFTTSSIST